MKYFAIVLLILGSVGFGILIDSGKVELSEFDYNNWNETIYVCLMLGWAMLIVTFVADLILLFKKEN